MTVRLPKPIANAVMKWGGVYPSPRSSSLYDTPYSEGYRCGTHRVSNHWNYDGKFRTVPMVQNGFWTLARFNSEVWIVQMTKSPSKNLKKIEV